MINRNPLESIVTNEIDYQFLLGSLKNYKFPRNKIGSMLKNGSLVRVKKGVYVRRKSDFNFQVLANMIYGPSYVSQEYALSWYGLIPERVHQITSVTLGRNKEFRTPVGVFSYQHLSLPMYSVGVSRIEVSSTQAFLIATPEKALIDLIYKKNGLNTIQELEDFLRYDQRIELDSPLLKADYLQELVLTYSKPVVKLLEQVMSKRATS